MNIYADRSYSDLSVYTVPSSEELKNIAAVTPEYMHPNEIPSVAVAQSWLSDEQCDAIIEEAVKVNPYRFPHCDATTRELNRESSFTSLHPIEDLARALNDKYWNFVLDYNPPSWLQTYHVGDSYQMHMDASPGSMRKMTAVALLSDPKEYDGGALRIFNIIGRREFVLPPHRGSVVVFMPWHQHQVDEVERGVRRTINMGFYGPPFR